MTRQGGAGRAVRIVVAFALAVSTTSLLIVATPAPAAAMTVGAVTLVGSAPINGDAITTGPDGALWFIDSWTGSVVRRSPDGAITTFVVADINLESALAAGPDGAVWVTVGGGVARVGTAGDVAVFRDLRLTGLIGIALGPDGAMWFTDHVNNLIGRITMLGVVTTYDAPSINDPVGIAAGPDGAMWFVNRAANSIGRITTAGVVSNFTGVGVSWAWSIRAGPDGAMWFANMGNDSIGRISMAGVVSSFTGAGVDQPLGITSGPDGALWFTNYGTGAVGRITTTGAISMFVVAGFRAEWGIAAGPDGAMWVTSDKSGSLGRVTMAGVASTVSPSNPPFGAQGPTTGPDGAVWFSDALSNKIGRVTPAGAVTTYSDAKIDEPTGLVAGPDGALWFANRGTNSIGRITTAGVVSRFDDPAISGPATMVAGADGALWFVNTTGDSIGRITTAGVVSTFADATVSDPRAITAGPDGALWFTNRGNSSIGRITTSGVITNVDDPAMGAPFAIVTGSDGALWFTADGSIGRLTTGGAISWFTQGPAAMAGWIAAGPDGALWFTRRGGYPDIGRLTTSGALSEFTGYHPQPWQPPPQLHEGIAAGPDGAMWIGADGDGLLRVQALPPPSAPASVSALAGKARATVTWSASSTNGGPPVTGYRAVASPGGASCTWTAGPRSCEIVGLMPGTSYTFRVVAENAYGEGPLSSPSAAVRPWSGAAFHPVTPVRVLDTRAPGAPFGSLAAGEVGELFVVGGGVSAVVMNVTATDGTDNSFVTAWPAGQPQPNSSNLNFAAGQTIANLVTVGVGPGGKVNLANANGSADLVADLVGYFDDGTGSGDLFNAVTSTRALDSRTSTGGWTGPLTAGIKQDVTILGAGSTGVVPPTATAVVINVTATAATKGSFLRVWPSGLAPPTTSTLNFAAGQTIANLVTAKIGANGRISLANAVGSTHVIVDIVGYFDPTDGDRFHTVTPHRYLDDRFLVGAPGPWGPNQTRTVALTGSPEIPDDATGIVTNITATNATTGSYLTVHPGGSAPPGSSNLNFGPGETIPNLVMTGVGPGGVAITNRHGTVDVVGDVLGYFAEH